MKTLEQLKADLYAAEVSGDTTLQARLLAEIGEVEGAWHGDPTKPENSTIAKSERSDMAVHFELKAIRKTMQFIAVILTASMVSGVLGGLHLTAKLNAAGARYSFERNELYWGAFGLGLFVFILIMAVSAGLVTMVTSSEDKSDKEGASASTETNYHPPV